MLSICCQQHLNTCMQSCRCCQAYRLNKYTINIPWYKYKFYTLLSCNSISLTIFANYLHVSKHTIHNNLYVCMSVCSMQLIHSAIIYYCEVKVGQKWRTWSRFRDVNVDATPVSLVRVFSYEYLLLCYCVLCDVRQWMPAPKIILYYILPMLCDVDIYTYIYVFIYVCIYCLLALFTIYNTYCIIFKIFFFTHTKMYMYAYLVCVWIPAIITNSQILAGTFWRMVQQTYFVDFFIFMWFSFVISVLISPATGKKGSTFFFFFFL